LEPNVGGAVDLAHAARTERAGDPVVREIPADHADTPERRIRRDTHHLQAKAGPTAGLPWPTRAAPGGDPSEGLSLSQVFAPLCPPGSAAERPPELRRDPVDARPQAVAALAAPTPVPDHENVRPRAHRPAQADVE